MERPVVGQEVAYFSGYGGGNGAFRVLKVKRVTPKGQIVVEWPNNFTNIKGELKFGADGYELGTGSKWYRGYIRTDVDACRGELEKKRLRRAAADALNAVKLEHGARDTWGDDSLREALAELEAKLDAARAAVQKIV